MIETLSVYLQHKFVVYALIVGVLIALSSSLLGVTLVLKRFSFIGDGLSHVAFGGMAIASVLSLTNKMILILPITVVCAILLLRTGQNTRIKGDAAIAMISVGALAFGYLIMNAKAVGTKADGYNLLIAVVIAIIIVLAMNLVGSLLISALVIFPALSAMRVFKNFKSVTVCAAIISVACAFGGMIISILAGTPVGSTIVAVDIGAFIISTVIGKICGGVSK